MQNYYRSLLRAFFSLLILTSLTAPASAGEESVKILSPFDAEGEVFKVGNNLFQFIGTFEGILYLESDKGDLHTAFIVCPTVQDIDTSTGKTEAKGRCHIVAAGGNVFGKFVCKGEVGTCKGKFTLTGGTDDLEGISGSGEMLVRSALRTMVVDAESGKNIRKAKGLAVWPKLNYKVPEKKKAKK